MTFQGLRGKGLEWSVPGRQDFGKPRGGRSSKAQRRINQCRELVTGGRRATPQGLGRRMGSNLSTNDSWHVVASDESKFKKYPDQMKAWGCARVEWRPSGLGLGAVISLTWTETLTVARFRGWGGRAGRSWKTEHWCLYLQIQSPKKCRWHVLMVARTRGGTEPGVLPAAHPVRAGAPTSCLHSTTPLLFTFWPKEAYLGISSHLEPVCH